MNGNLFDLLRTHWSVAPDRQFLVATTGDAITYREMDRRSGQFATVLRSQQRPRCSSTETPLATSPPKPTPPNRG